QLAGRVRRRPAELQEAPAGRQGPSDREGRQGTAPEEGLAAGKRRTGQQRTNQEDCRRMNAKSPTATAAGLRNGAAWVAHALEAEGVDTIFGYPGGAIMPFYDALVDSGLRHILVRHEQGAALAANGYARASGRVGVCVATSGPGASNLVTGIADAMLDSVPMVCLTGQVPTTLLGTDAFQELDVFGMTMPIVKHSFLVRSVDDLPHVMAE